MRWPCLSGPPFGVHYKVCRPHRDWFVWCGDFAGRSSRVHVLMSFIDAPRLTSIAPFSPAEERRPCPLHASRRTPDGDHAVIGEGSPDPAVRPTGGFQVTRRRSGTRSARVSWTRHSAERRSPRDAPTVGGWESCGRRGRGVRRPLPEPATGRDCSSSTTSVNHRSPPSMSRRVRYQRTEQMGRKKSRKVRETRSLYSRKRPERRQKCRQRLELGIHGLNRWLVKC